MVGVKPKLGKVLEKQLFLEILRIYADTSKAATSQGHFNINQDDQMVYWKSFIIQKEIKLAADSY